MFLAGCAIANVSTEKIENSFDITDEVEAGTIYVSAEKYSYPVDENIVLNIYNSLEETIVFETEALGLKVEKYNEDGKLENYGVETSSIEKYDFNLNNKEKAKLTFYEDLSKGNYRLSIHGVGDSSNDEISGYTEVKITEDE